MGYFHSARGRAIVLGFVASSLLLAAFPQIDLFVSGLFYAGGFPFSASPLQRLIRDATSGFVYLAIFGTAAVYLFNRVLGAKLWGIDGRRLSYLFIVLVVGAGFIVNFGLKDNFGRARPREVVAFGGTRDFTPAFAISRECRNNCSFSSGEAAAGFFSIALVYALARRRRAALAAALAFGTLVSLARIASGAHFFSDTVVSFFVMLLLADSLFYFMRLAPPEIEAIPAPELLVRVGSAPVTPAQSPAAAAARRTTPAG